MNCFRVVSLQKNLGLMKKILSFYRKYCQRKRRKWAIEQVIKSYGVRGCNANGIHLWEDICLNAEWIEFYVETGKWLNE